MSTENPERRRIYWCDDSQVMWTGLVPVGVEPMAIGHACEIHGGRTSSIDYGKGTYRCETSHEHAIPAQWLELRATSRKSWTATGPSSRSSRSSGSTRHERSRQIPQMTNCYNRLNDR